MFKKKKYVRSPWFEGLLKAESLFKEGFYYECEFPNDLPWLLQEIEGDVYLKRVNDKGVEEQKSIRVWSKDKTRGSVDYIGYVHQVLNRLD